MYVSLTSTLKTQFEAISEIQEVYDYPTPDIEGYPAIIFFPVSAVNRFEDNQDNLIEHTYKVWVVVGESSNKRMDEAPVILNTAVDAFIADMKTNWSIAGEDGKTWAVIDRLEFGYETTERGYTHFCEIDIIIKSKY